MMMCEVQKCPAQPRAIRWYRHLNEAKLKFRKIARIQASSLSFVVLSGDAIAPKKLPLPMIISCSVQPGRGELTYPTSNSKTKRRVSA